MGSKKILEHTPYGALLVRRKGESIAAFVKRQTKEFKKHLKKKEKK